MRLPRFRFTVRRLMVAVAVVGLILGLAEWSRRRAANFRELARYQDRDGFLLELWVVDEETGHPSEYQIDSIRRVIDYRQAMSAKYWKAQRHPWLPVAPDPPEPELIPRGASDDP